MIRLKRDPREEDAPRFEAAGPTLGERLAAAWTRRKRRPVRSVVSVLALPLYVAGDAARALAVFVRHALTAQNYRLHKRRLRDLALGLPAVAAVTAACTAAALVANRRHDLPGVYRRAAASAYLADRPQDARLYYERLYQLDGGTAETRLMLGLTLEKLGDAEGAAQLIRGVADGDAGGDPRANRWVAVKLLSAPDALSDPRKVREAQRHLIAAERGLPKDASLKLDLARFYLRTGRPQEAVSRLSAAATADPALNYDLAQLHAALGRPEAAHDALTRAEQHLRGRLEAKPEDRKARLLLAGCLMNLGHAEEAVVLLQQGTAVDPEGPYRAAIADIYVAAYDRLAAQRQPDYKAMVSALREALRHDPKSAKVAERLAQFGAGLPSGQAGVGDDVTRLLEELLVSGEQPSLAHMALGLTAWRRDDPQGAVWHFEQAYALDPSLAGVANNLAWVLAHREPPDLDRALSVIGPVLDRWPDVPDYLDTRGEIYLRLGRWEDALRDLEKALPARRADARIHRSLASAYEEVGRPEIAEGHRREADRIASGRAAADPTPAAGGT